MKKPESQEISIQHQETKAMHNFIVADSNNLTNEEVKMICEEMGVSALFVEGKYYNFNRF